MRDMGQKPNELVEKTLFKERIQDVDYTPILAGLDMMEPSSRIQQFKADISKFGENMKRKHKVQAVRKYCMALGYMEDLEHG